MDRKAWIVIIICSIGLAVNWHLMQKRQAEYAEQQREEAAREEAEKPKVDPSKPEKDPVVGGEPSETLEPSEPEAKEEFVTFETADAIYTLTTHGGGIKSAEFKGQYAVGDKEHQVLFNRFGKHPIGAVVRGTDRFLDLKYKLVPDSVTERSASFVGRTPGGLVVLKEWSLVSDEKYADDYRLNLKVTLENYGEVAFETRDLGLFTGSAAPLWKGERPEYSGFFYLQGDDYTFKKISWFKKGKKGPFEEKIAPMTYAGVGNQFFTCVVAPKEPYDSTVWAASSSVQLEELAGGGDAFEVGLGFSFPSESLGIDGDKKVLDFELFIGPKRNTMLRKMGGNYGDLMNYGSWFGMGYISRFLNWVLNLLHSWVFDPISKTWSWGFSIIALTIVIRGAMWPLQNKSTRAMKRMSKLQPEMQALKEKYPDDPNKMNQEMMKMYREYGINPVGGCLPLLVQIPIFFGFYRMLQYAVELRQQKFLWVEDLSQPDTLFELPFSLPFLGNGFNLLPILMAATMVGQMMLTPKTGDKMQRRIFMLMPLIFFFFCYNFASALALYWTTSNIFAIAQTLITQRLPEPELKKRAKNKKGLWQRMQERAEEAQKAQKARQGEAMGNKGKKGKKRRPKTGG